MLSEKKLKDGWAFEAGEYHVWYFNKFRADKDWSKNEDESEREFDTYAELAEFVKKNSLAGKFNRYGVTGSVFNGAVTLEAYPDDRGGYVVWVRHGDDRCYYYEPANEWCE